MTIQSTPKGFNRLDFGEMKMIAALAGFDILACARTKKSCGPGCDWLVQDKRYYTLMLLSHIEALLESRAAVPQSVLAWHEKASNAAREYRHMEEKLYPVLGLKRSTRSIPDR